MDTASTSSEAMLAVTLTTKSSKYPAIPTSKYFVPASWKRYQLSELLNKVIGYDDQPVPFDFVLFDGKELLRSTLSDVLASHGLTEVSKRFKRAFIACHSSTLLALLKRKLLWNWNISRAFYHRLSCRRYRMMIGYPMSTFHRSKTNTSHHATTAPSHCWTRHYQKL